MKNDRGTFIEISEFHSGSQQGGIRVPEGRRGIGWALFEKELRRYFLNEKPYQMGSSAVGRQRLDGDRINPGRKRDLGKGIDNGSGSTAQENNRPKSRAQLMADAPRPTRRYDFLWKPRYKTLRITITEGDKRMGKWTSINDPKQARNKETRANPQADKGTWVPKQN